MPHNANRRNRAICKSFRLWGVGKVTRPGKYAHEDRRQGGKRALAGIVSVALTVSIALPAYSVTVASADDATTYASKAASAYSVDEQIHYMRALLEKDTAAIGDREALQSVLAGLGFSEQAMRELAPECLDAFDDDCCGEIKRLQRLLDSAAQPGDAEGDASDLAAGPGAKEPGDAPAAPDTPAAPSTPSSPSTAPSTIVPVPEESAQELDLLSLYPQWSYAGDRSMPAHRDVDLTQRTFIALYGEHARAIAQESGIYASVMLAQAILESDSGNSDLASSPNNNLFRIEATDEAKSVTKTVTETAADGTTTETEMAFATYDSPYDSMEDYAKFLRERSGELFEGALKAQADDCFAACDWMQDRYSDEADYAEKLKSIIREHGLEKYDEPLDYELVDEFVFPVLDKQGKQVVNPETKQPVTERRTLLDLEEELASHLGDPYVWGGTTPGSFDCSGLVQYSYMSSLGVMLPRTTFYQCLVGEDVDFADLHTGDLLFFTDSRGLCSHVGVYLGEGCFIEAPHAGDVVRVTTMEEKMPAFAKRVLETKPVERQDAAQGESTGDGTLVEPRLPLLDELAAAQGRDAGSINGFGAIASTDGFGTRAGNLGTNDGKLLPLPTSLPPVHQFERSGR